MTRIFFSMIVLLSSIGLAIAQESLDDKSLAQEQVFLRLSQEKLAQLGRLEHLRTELAVDDEQLAALDEAMKKHYSRAQEFGEYARNEQKKIQKLIEEGKRDQAEMLSKEMMKPFRENLRVLRKEIAEFFRAEQLTRLDQIVRQTMAKRHNPFGDNFGTTIGIADEIQLTNEEKLKLLDKIVDVRKRYYDDIAKLKESAQAEIMATIPEDKQAKIEGILGKEFVPKLKQTKIDDYRTWLKEQINDGD